MNEASYRVGCVLMAAGNAERFQGNKLLAVFEGATLYERALRTIPAEAFYRVVVVTQYAEFLEPAHNLGFCALLNDRPGAGVSHTIALGIGALPSADAILFMVADQPLLSIRSVRDLVALQKASPGSIAALAYEGKQGNPCVFPRSLFGELLALTGDAGGSAVLRAHRDALVLCPAHSPWELVDVDTQQALQAFPRTPTPGGV